MPLVVLLGLLLAACSEERGDRDPAVSVPRPVGVLLVVVDTLRADHLGSYGSTAGLTPNLDRLAASSLRFEQAIAPSSWTRPSMAALFTSRYPASVSVLGRDDVLSTRVTTLAEVLRVEGYQTLGVITNNNAGAALGFAQGFDRFETPSLREGYPEDFQIHIAEGVTERALRLVDELDHERPFFLYLHYVDPHDPYLPHPELGRGPEPAGRFDGSRRDLARLDRARPEEVEEVDRERIRFLYAGEVAYCDLWIGRLLDGLAERGLADRLVIVVTSDHGEGLWDHGERAHGVDLYQEQLRVPLILRLPTSTPGEAQRAMASPASLLDVAPTVLSALGIDIPDAFEGVDLLAGARREPGRILYSELLLDGRDLDAAHDGPLKLIRDRARVARSALPELYDLERDPAEQRDLAPTQPRQRARLEGWLADTAELLSAGAEPLLRVAPEALTPETVASLQALGYVAADQGSSSRLDFGVRDHSEQLLAGFYERANGRRWMAGRASLLLAVPEDASQLRVEGWIDLELHGVDAVALEARVGGALAASWKLERSGPFELEAPLDGASSTSRDYGSLLRIDMRCDHDFVPAHRLGSRDPRRFCVVIRSVALH